MSFIIIVPVDVKVIKTIYILTCLAFNKWAMKEINPTHEDVPKIMCRLNYLSEEYRKLWG